MEADNWNSLSPIPPGETHPNQPDNADWDNLETSDEHFGSAGQQAITALEQGASGATLGTSKIAETKLLGVNPEDIEAREAANPVTSFASNLAGTGALLAGTGGLGLEAEEGASLASKIGSGLKQGAALGGVNAFSSDVAENPNITASKLISDTALSGIIGAGVGGAGSLLGSAVEGVANKSGQFFSDMVNRLQDYAQNPNPADAMAKELQPYLDMNQNGLNIFGDNGIKMQAIQKLMPNSLSDQMVGQAQDLLQKGRSAIQTMAADPDYYSRFYTSALNRNMNVLSDALSEPGEPFEIFQAMNDFKQRLDDVIPHGNFERASLSPADKPAVNMLSDLTNEVRQNLQDPETWGNAGQVQKDINSAFARYLPDLKDFQSKFTAKSADGSRILDPQKLQTYLNQAGKPGQVIRKQMLGDFIDSSENLRDSVNKVTAQIGGDNSIVPQSLQYTKSTLGDLTPGAKVADQIWKKGLSNVAGEGAGIGIGAAAGSYFGSPLVGGWIGEKVLGPTLSSLIPPEAFGNPIRVLGGLSSVTDKVNRTMANKARLIFTGTSAQARKFTNE